MTTSTKIKKRKMLAVDQVCSLLVLLLSLPDNTASFRLDNKVNVASQSLVIYLKRATVNDFSSCI